MFKSIKLSVIGNWTLFSDSLWSSFFSNPFFSPSFAVKSNCPSKYSLLTYWNKVCWLKYYCIVLCWHNTVLIYLVHMGHNVLYYVLNKAKPNLEKVVYLGGQFIDQSASLLSPQILLWLGHHELPVSGPSRSELQQEVRSFLIAGHASEAILECSIREGRSHFITC